MKTVLVTGASGLLGHAVVEQLAAERDMQVVAVVSGRREVAFPEGVRVEACNLLNEEERTALVARIRPEVLCHLAWGQETPDYRSSFANLQWLEASCSLLRAFAAYSGQRFLFAGSCTEYDDCNGKAQDVPQRLKRSLYGECKHAFSDVMHNSCEAAGLQYANARFFTIYGEGDPHKFGAIPSAISTLMKNQPVVCKAPNTIRDYIYVEDAAAALVRLVNSQYCGEVNISSGHPLSMRTIFSAIARELGKEDLLSFENEHRCDQVLVGDNSVLKEKIGFSKFVPFEQGIKKVIANWINMENGGGVLL